MINLLAHVNAKMYIPNNISFSIYCSNIRDIRCTVQNVSLDLKLEIINYKATINCGT